MVKFVVKLVERLAFRLELVAIYLLRQETNASSCERHRLFGIWSPTSGFLADSTRAVTAVVICGERRWGQTVYRQR